MKSPKTEEYLPKELAIIEKEILQSKSKKEIEFIPFDTSYPEIIAETICAFMNTNGGHLIIGQSEEMNNKEHPFENTELIEMWIKLLFREHQENYSLRERVIQQIPFIQIDVKKTNKPVYFLGNFYERTKMGNVLNL